MTLEHKILGQITVDSETIVTVPKPFAAVAYNPTTAAYSTDAITWTETTLPGGANWKSVTYGDGTFAAVARGSAIAAYSTDAITWTQTTLPTNDGWYSVTYGDGTFAAVAYNSSVAAYSTDAITWTEATLPTSAYWKGVTHGDVNHQEAAYTVTQAVYTVPSNTQALVSSIFISNTATTTDTYNFAIVPSGETLSDIHQIRKNTDITAKDFHNIETKITMSAGDSLVALSGGSDKLNITVFGVEKL